MYYIASVTFDSNIYIYGKKILIDTGFSNDHAYRIIDNMNKYEVNIDRIVLTHNHPDHSSNIDIFQKEFNAKVCVHETIAKKYSYLGEYLEVLHEGDILIIDENLELQVIYTPGHSEGGICLYDASNKILFSGDTIFSDGNIGRTDLGGDIQTLIKSIEKLLKLDVEVLCPGHMDAVKNGNKHVKMSYEFAKQAQAWGI